ncbi:MAG: class III signal peptide-containing protein [Methanobrevibacter boviskoreani]|uniref:class III signal peptide-containing protein n=1 Tax=Methanobrevibacter boviskoreani TaxID=1348249 RepID=UPI003D8A78C0
MLNKIFDELNSQVSSELILLIGGILIIVLITINLYKNYMFNTYYSLNNSEIPDFNQSINKVSGRFKNF